MDERTFPGPTHTAFIRRRLAFPHFPLSWQQIRAVCHHRDEQRVRHLSVPFVLAGGGSPMATEAQLVVERATLRWLAEQHPDWTQQELATYMGRSPDWVKKWGGVRTQNTTWGVHEKWGNDLNIGPFLEKTRGFSRLFMT